jgi:hypothetical protein
MARAGPSHRLGSLEIGIDTDAPIWASIWHGHGHPGIGIGLFEPTENDFTGPSTGLPADRIRHLSCFRGSFRERRPSAAVSIGGGEGIPRTTSEERAT